MTCSDLVADCNTCGILSRVEAGCQSETCCSCIFASGTSGCVVKGQSESVLWTVQATIAAAAKCPAHENLCDFGTFLKFAHVRVANIRLE